MRVGVVVALVCAALNIARNHAGLHPRHLELGSEYFQIAVALAEGRGFSDPFGAGTGATGWMPPAFSILLWGVNGLTGGAGRHYSAVFIPALIGLKCLCLGAGTGWLWGVWRDCRGAGGRAGLGFFVGCVVVLGWGQWDHVTASMHDGWWVAFVAALCLRGVVGLRRRRPSGVLAAGLALAAFSSPVVFAATLAAVLARTLTLARVSRRAGWRLGLRPALPALALGLACFGGWSARVYASTGIWAPVKSNGGFELWQALEHTSAGVPTHSTFELHPGANAVARAEYAAEGEKGFVERRAQEARARIAREPALYLAHVVNRARNAFVAMQRRRDTFQVGGRIPDALREELVRERLLVPGPEAGKWRFLFLAEDDARRNERLSRLSSEAGALLRTAWSYFDKEERAESWWSRLDLPEFAVSGLVSLAWVAALRLASARLRRRIALLLIFYLGMLAPYVLVSHYYRYQEGVMGVQALALGFAVLLIAAKWQERRQAGLAA
jgi:hypothetical protein